MTVEKSIRWLLRDEFSDTLAAGNVNGTKATDGRNTRTAVDTSNVMSVGTGKLRFSGNGTDWDNPKLFYGPFFRRPGLALFASVQNATQSSGVYYNYVGFTTNPANSRQNMSGGFNVVGEYCVTHIQDAGTLILNYPVPTNSYPSQQGTICRGTGWFHVVRDGLQWKLVYVGVNGTGTGNMYPVVGGNHVQGTWEVDGMHVAQLTGAWATDHDIATQYIAVSTDNHVSIATADFFMEHTITAQTGVTQELSFRMADVDNRLIVRMSQPGSTIKIIERKAAVETELASAAQTWTNGASYRICIQAEAAWIVVLVNDVYATRVVSEPWNQTATGVKASNAGTNLITWPRMVALPSFLLPPQRAFFAYGDSKTWGVDSTAGRVNGRNGYEPYLSRYLQEATGAEWDELPLRVGRSGYTIAQLAASVDADLSARSDTPSVVLINIGANDYISVIDATWSTNYAYILDAMHAKWPSAQVYCMRVWRRSGTSLVAMKSAIGVLVAARSSWCYLGPDETVFLENGDDGTTYTVIGIHPNEAGYALTAHQWASVILA